MPWGIQHLFQDSPSKVFSFQKVAFKGAAINPTQEASKRRASRPGPDVHTACQASGREAGQSPRTRRLSNARSLREGEGPDAQDQSSTQPKNRGRPDAQDQSSTQPKNRKASRLGESYSPHGALLPLHRTTTSQSLVRDGGRSVTTVKDSSLWTQAVNPKKGWKLQGQNP